LICSFLLEEILSNDKSSCEAEHRWSLSLCLSCGIDNTNPKVFEAKKCFVSVEFGQQAIFVKRLFADNKITQGEMDGYLKEAIEHYEKILDL